MVLDAFESSANPQDPRRVTVLGVPISVVDMDTAVATISRWVAQKKTRYVCAPDVYNVVSAQDNERHMAALRKADLIIPDGTPLTWVMRLRGEKIKHRVCGPDLMMAVCKHSAPKGWSHYFYGGAEGVGEDLAMTLVRTFPGLRIAGVECPPFRHMSEPEIASSIDRINNANPTIVWVGLGCPKQELWMAENSARINAAVLIGVGAAFDFHTGRVQRAPLWMRTNGLEWLHRLASEPRRLWRRYLISAPRFLFASFAETVRINIGMERH